MTANPRTPSSPSRMRRKGIPTAPPLRVTSNTTLARSPRSVETVRTAVALEAGMSDYVSKPIDHDELFCKLCLWTGEPPPNGTNYERCAPCVAGREGRCPKPTTSAVETPCAASPGAPDLAKIMADLDTLDPAKPKPGGERGAA